MFLFANHFMIYCNPKVKDHWIVCFMLIKLVNDAKVELEI